MDDGKEAAMDSKIKTILNNRTDKSRGVPESRGEGVSGRGSSQVTKAYWEVD